MRKGRFSDDIYYTSLLQDNKLSQLDRAVLNDLLHLKSLSLWENPWRCDCSLSSVWRWLSSRRLLSSSVLCSHPPARADIQWDKLGESLSNRSLLTY